MLTVVPMLSPQKAALRVGVSRQTVVNAIKSGKLEGRRNNNNAWLIAPSDLDRWAEGRNAKHVKSSSPTTQTLTGTSTATLHQKEVEIARLEERLRASDHKVIDMQVQLDRERQTVDDLRRRLDRAENRLSETHPPKQVPSFWRRLLQRPE